MPQQAAQLCAPPCHPSVNRSDSQFSKKVAWPLGPVIRNCCLEVGLEFHADLEVLKLDVLDHTWQPDSVGKLNDADRVRSNRLELGGRQMYHGVRHQFTSTRQFRP